MASITFRHVTTPLIDAEMTHAGDHASWIEELYSGGEPSLEEKREAKRIAWSNGCVPTETRHVIHHRDARHRTVAPESVQLIVTSPPYFNLIEYAEQEDERQLGHIDDYVGFLSQLDKVWKRCFTALAPGGRMCVVVGDVCLSRREAGRHHVLPLHADIAARCRKIGFDYLTPIYWSKIANMATEVGGNSRFLGKPYEPNAVIKNDVEYVLLLRKPGGYRKPTSVQRALSLLDPDEHSAWFRTIWNDVPGENRKAGHPAPYPVEIAFRLIRMFSFVGDTVLDPFWGTGTTSVAAARTFRNSVGIEIEKKYVEIGTRRMAQLDALVPAVVDVRIS